MLSPLQRTTIQLSGYVGFISCSKNVLADLRGHHVLVCSDNTLVVSYINHQGVCGHVHFANWCAKSSCAVPREVAVSSSRLHPGGPQYRSRHPVETGAEAREIEVPPRGGGADMEGVRTQVSQPRLLRPFYTPEPLPPPFENADQERHNLLCPVRGLDAYVHRSALWHKN